MREFSRPASSPLREDLDWDDVYTAEVGRLFYIARNVLIDHVRATRLHVPFDEAPEIMAHDTPETKAEARSDLARLAALTAGLRGAERDLIALKYGAELNRTNATAAMPDLER